MNSFQTYLKRLEVVENNDKTNKNPYLNIKIHNKIKQLISDELRNIPDWVKLNVDGLNSNDIDDPTKHNEIFLKKYIDYINNFSYCSSNAAAIKESIVRIIFNSNSLNVIQRKELSSGSYGNTYKIKLGTIGELLLKLSKKDSKNFNRDYEYYMSLVMNRLRLNGLINITYTIGMFDCQNNICDSENTKFILQELNNGYVTAKLFPSLIRNNLIKSDEYFSMMFQVAMSSAIMYKNGLKHNDMHTGNVMIGVCTNPFVIKYHYDDDDYFLTTNILVKIIDFGMVSELKNNLNFAGKYSFQFKKQDELSDVFRFVAESTYRYLNYKFLMNEINYIANFFIENLARDLRNTEIPKWCYFSLPSGFNNNIHYDFINHLMFHPMCNVTNVKPSSSNIFPVKTKTIKKLNNGNLTYDE